MAGKNSLLVEADLANLAAVRRFVETTSAALGAGAAVVSDLKLAVDEAVTNIIIHGYKQSSGSIEIGIDKDEAAIVVRLKDNAVEFNPCFRAKPDLEAIMETETGGGFGIHMIKNAVDKIQRRVPIAGGNELTLIKRVPATAKDSGQV